eukprot:6263150-Lingulodinium_polyedra.AAC.1
MVLGGTRRQQSKFPRAVDVSQYHHRRPLKGPSAQRIHLYLDRNASPGSGSASRPRSPPMA